MRRKTSSRFIVRWAVSSLGLWLASALLGSDKVSFQDSAKVVIIAGLVLAVINMLLKPLVVFLSLPAVLLSLGIFMLVINGFMVVVASRLYQPLQVANFGVAIITGIVIGLTNFLVSAIVDDSND